MSLKIQSKFSKFSENFYPKYAAQLFANTLGTTIPKIKIENKKLQQLWDEFADEQSILDINYNLIYQTSLNGMMVLGIMVNKKNEPIITIGKPNLSLCEITNSKFTKLIFQKFSLTNSGMGYNDIVEYDSGKYKKFACKVKCESSREERVTSQLFGTLTAPFILTKSNPLALDDFHNIENRLLADLNKHLELLLTDSLVAKSLVHINTPTINTNTDAINDLINAINDPTTTVYKNKNIFSLLQSAGLQIQQGVSNHQAILDNIKFYENKIRQFAFLPKSTLDSGTKNIHSQEMSLVNSDSDDYIEMKANLLENSWKQLVKIYIDYLVSYKKISPLNINQIKIDVEVAGSTKYLQNVDNEYIQNQQGVLTNPNDLIKNSNEKKSNSENEGDK